MHDDLHGDRCCPLADPRRRDLFSAVRLRREEASGREKRRRRRVSLGHFYQKMMVVFTHENKIEYNRRGLKIKGYIRVIHLCSYIDFSFSRLGVFEVERHIAPAIFWSPHWFVKMTVMACNDSHNSWKQAVVTRRSEEVLAGMLTRTGRDAHTSQPGQQHSRNSSVTLVLLRAGCPRLAVQHLYKSEEVGLGQAMGLAEDGGTSDLDSGAIVAGQPVECHGRVGTFPSKHRQW